MAAIVTVGAGVLGGAAIATASDGPGQGRSGYGFGGSGGPGGPGGAEGGPPWQHGGPFAADEVTGSDLASVTEAVAAYDDTLTVDHVVAREEGGWLVLATTDDDARTVLTVSADLDTVEELEGPPGGPGAGGPGRPGGPPGPEGHLGAPDGAGPEQPEGLPDGPPSGAPTAPPTGPPTGAAPEGSGTST